MLQIFKSFLTPPSPSEKKIAAVRNDVISPSLHVFTKVLGKESHNEPLKRLSKIEQEELIAAHSLLERPPQTNPLKEIDHLDALLGHIHADLLVGNSKIVESISLGCEVFKDESNQVKSGSKENSAITSSKAAEHT